MTPAVKVLVVDDEPLLQALIEQHFRKQIESREMEFVFAGNGVEALKKLQQDGEIGVILTDINMPEMDGLTLLTKIADLNRLYRPVVVSAYGDMKNIRAAMNRGASDFIMKPIDFDDLRITINKTINQYRYLQQAAKAKDEIVKFSKELEIAHNIQKLFIPSDFKPYADNNNVSLYGEMISAKEVGGDFFDFFVLDSQRLALVIGDVSGKGIPAALFMAMSHALIRAVAVGSANTAECMEKVNHLLCWNNDTCMFVTMFYGIIDISTGEFQYCNAGHNYPYALLKNGSIEKVSDSHGTALGVIDKLHKLDLQPDYEEKKLKLNAGDTLLFYTDGVIEASNSKFEFYQERRLEEYLRAYIDKPIDELVDDLKKDIFKFIAGTHQFDDITLLAVRYNGPSN